MIGQELFLARLTTLLAAAGIPFMLSGSLASGIYGQPRATNDIDIVIDPTNSTLDRFLKSLPKTWYVSAEAAIDALLRRSMFNVIDPETGWKADLVVRKERPFSLEEFRRRATMQVLGNALPVVTPEDSILSKLEWSRESASQNQYADALAVVSRNLKNLDREYLHRWAKELGLTSLLNQLLDQAQRTGYPSPPSTP